MRVSAGGGWWVALLAVAWAPAQGQTQGQTTAVTYDPAAVMYLMSQGCGETSCNCYYSSDCGSGQTCGGYFNCKLVGKLDGTCRSSGGGGVWEVADLTVAAEGVREYFRAFEISAADPTGKTVAEAIAQLDRVQSRRLTGKGHLAVQELTLDALDLTVGFDLIRASTRLCTLPVPTLRVALHGPEAALVAAVREGLAAAIESGDPGRLEAPLRRFWSEHPDFEPDHTGRCYEHGHREYPYDSALDCQLTELRGLLGLYLPPKGK
jgi:hypothetical protein